MTENIDQFCSVLPICTLFTTIVALENFSYRLSSFIKLIVNSFTMAYKCLKKVHCLKPMVDDKGQNFYFINQNS